LKVLGYAIGVRAGRVSVRIEADEYKNHQAYFRERATRRPAAALVEELAALPYERTPRPGGNARHPGPGQPGAKEAGLDEVPLSCLRLRRRIVSAFGPGEKGVGGV